MTASDIPATHPPRSGESHAADGAVDETKALPPTPPSRRQALVHAAFTRIARDGLEGLRLRQVADDVGIDHSTLHHHVKTKQDLVLAVASYVAERYARTIPTGPDPTLQQHLELTRAMLRDQPEFGVVALELELRARRDPVIEQALHEHQRGWREALAGMANRARWGPGAVELIMATSKGVRLQPDSAALVEQQLMALLDAASGGH